MTDFSITTHSRSFALASRILDPRTRDHTAVVYAWCRRADDSVDECDPAFRAVAVAQLARELDVVYAGAGADDPVLARFATVVRERQIPRIYPDELVAGMAMDAAATRYRTLDDLRTYAYRVAGTVGLMMAHVFGVADNAALTSAAHLGMAMQLTNICRDVAEDWQRGRLYIPDELLADYGAGGLAGELDRGGAIPKVAIRPVASAIDELLAIADRYYRSGDQGIAALPWRAALAAASARRIYAAIGTEIARTGHDVTAGRAIVPRRTKLALIACAAIQIAAGAPRRWFARRRIHVPSHQLELADVARA